jgi:hypothetical protein
MGPNCHLKCRHFTERLAEVCSQGRWNTLLVLENLALRRQLAIMEGKHRKPRFKPSDRPFWILLLRMWSRWKRALILVQPKADVRRHRTGFQYVLDLALAASDLCGKKMREREIGELIFRMVVARKYSNPP